MKKIIFILTLILLISGCTKDKPPIGYYIGTFTGYYSIENENYSIYFSNDLLITEIDKDHIHICVANIQTMQCKSGYKSILNKNGRKISGELYLSNGYHTPPFFDINGKYKKSSGTYTISGDFTSSIYMVVDSVGTEKPLTGTFEIYSTF